MENLRISIQTWGGHVTAEQLTDAITLAFRQLSGAKVISCTIDGVDKQTALSTSTLLIVDKKLNVDEARITRYGDLSIKYHP